MSFFSDIMKIDSPSAAIFGPTTTTTTSSMTTALNLKAQMMEYQEQKSLAREAKQYGYTLQVGYNSRYWELLDEMTGIPYYDYKDEKIKFELEEIGYIVRSGKLGSLPWEPVTAAVEAMFSELSAGQRHEATLIARDYLARLPLAYDEYEANVEANKALINLQRLSPAGRFNPLTFAQGADK